MSDPADLREASDETSPSPLLVVDDDHAFCLALSASLRRRGATVVIAHDREEGLAEARAWRPERVVVDLRMPGGGLELVRELVAALPGVSIVVLTGYGSIATAVEAVKAGAVQYLTKPVPADVLLAAFEGLAPEHAEVDELRPASLDEVEWEHLQRVLTECGSNVSEAARRLGMHRRSLQRKLQRGPSARRSAP
jgi:two-component system response regulator RegA